MYCTWSALTGATYDVILMMFQFFLKLLYYNEKKENKQADKWHGSKILERTVQIL